MMALFLTVAAGLLAAIGLGAVLIGASLRRGANGGSDRGRGMFRVGTVALTLAGLVLLLGSMIGIDTPSGMFAGLMLVLFGTTVSLPPARTGATATRS